MRNLIAELLEAFMSIDDARAHLGLPLKWTKEDLKAAYKRAAFDNHPDRGGSTAKMSAINAAYQVLQNVEMGTSVSDGDYEDARLEKKGQMVKETINSLFDPLRYAQYFTKMTGKPFTFVVDDSVRSKYYSSSESYRKKVEWASPDRETVFSLDIYVNLTTLRPMKSLGAGGDAVLAFSVMLSPTVLHDNRKSKMRQRDWEFSTKEESLVDPTKVFPVASIKKMMKGADKARKFSKRDMEVAIEKGLGGRIEHQGGNSWARIPVGEYQLLLYRWIILRSPAWDIHAVQAKIDGQWKSFKPRKTAYHTESEELIEILKRVKKQTWNDPQTLADAVSLQMRKDRTESIRSRMEALL